MDNTFESISYITHKNKRKENQDRFIFNSECAFVFDGHGLTSSVSENLKINFYSIICKKILEFYSKDIRENVEIEKYVQKIIIQYDNYITSKNNINSGSTLSGFFFLSPSKIIVINLGDSRTMFKLKEDSFSNNGKVPFYVTKEHKVKLEKNMLLDRIKKGKLNNTIKNDRIDGGLNVSRAIGDSVYKPALSNICDVAIIDNAMLDYILVATDGLFDVLSTKDIDKIITTNQNSTADDIIQILMKKSLITSNYDNITIILCKNQKNHYTSVSKISNYTMFN